MTRLSTFAVAALAAALLCSSAIAQVRSPGSPITDDESFPGDVPIVTLDPPDVERYLIEDEANQHRPFRYGAVLKTTIGSDFAGRWDHTEDGISVWRVGVHSEGAYTLGIVFGIFRIPPGAQVFIYTPDKREVLGAYTDINLQPNGMLAIEPIVGDTAIVEYVLPDELRDEAPPLQIDEVIYDYRNLRDPRLFEVAGGAGGSPCLIDINCPQGANYQDVKRAVMRTLASGALCSASLITSANHDGVQYMLTANHCGSMTNGVFLFNYEKSGCGTGSAPSNQTVSGATKLASSSTYDSQLYRINTPIPASYGVIHAGWDRTTNTGAPAVSIGHGGGAPKQIAIDNNGAGVSGTDFVVFWNEGILIGGNSGGPLFNGFKRVIGPACCVTNFTCGAQTAFYGRFGGFWNAGNLAQWLDPTGTGAQFTDLFDPNAPTASCGSTNSYGTGCPGTWGITPTLSMSGCFSPGFQVTLDIQAGLGGSTALILFGLNEAATPLGAGCTLNVTPLLPLVVGPLPLSQGFPGQGSTSIDFTLPSDAAPGTFTMQAFINDAAVPLGFSNTNGQKVTIAP